MSAAEQSCAHPRELEICKRLWLDRQIALIDPVIVVLLGKIPITQVLNERSNLKESHGQMTSETAAGTSSNVIPPQRDAFPISG
jgi:uracil-DNA glycosylase